MLCSIMKLKKRIMKAEKEAMKSERINGSTPRTNAGNFVEGCRGNSKTKRGNVSNSLCIGEIQVILGGNESYNLH